MKSFTANAIRLNCILFAFLFLLIFILFAGTYLDIWQHIPRYEAARQSVATHLFRISDVDNSTIRDDQEPRISIFQEKLQGPLYADDPALVQYVKTNYLLPPSTLPYNFTDKNLTAFVLNLETSGFMFHQFLYKTFANPSSGFFVEAGALDGEVVSNTVWLEVKKKWTGLLIEPLNATYTTLTQKHRRAWSSCSCISPKKFAETTVLETPHQIKHSDSAVLHYQSNSRSVKSRFHTYDDNIKRTSNFTYSTVQCFPLWTYLLALNVTTVDVLSLDMQGGEKGTIYSLPLDKIKVRYMLIEYYKRGPDPMGKDEDFVATMGQKNYTLIQFGGAEYIFALKE